MQFGKATKKPVEIDWFKIEYNHPEHLKNWVESLGDDFDENFDFNFETGKTVVKTMEGHSYDVPIGYIIIRGVQGEYYPCESEIFEKTYDVITS